MALCVAPRVALAATLAGGLAACRDASPDARTPAHVACDGAAVRDVVTRFGTRLQDVSLLAPDSVLAGEMRGAYAALVTDALLRSWIRHPERAPGRQVSSPWPDRIEIHAASAVGSRMCEVRGDVVYVTSAEAAGTASREPVTLRLRPDGGWRITAYAAAPQAPQPDTATMPGAADTAVADPADVVRRYYAAIAARDYRTAYALWGNGGAASGQTYAAFAAGFAHTASVEADVGEPGRVEGAAGSRYVTVPVSVRATTAAGERQRFEGTYTLRRSVVDGASAAQRRWHIDSAHIVPAR